MKSITRDYHGFTTHQAWLDFKSVVDSASNKGISHIVIITGNGEISREIQTWVHNNSKVKSIKKLNYDNGKWIINIISQRKKISKYPKTLIEYYKLFNERL